MQVLTGDNNGFEIAALNSIINTYIREYLLELDRALDIKLSWDAPDPANPPSEPTLHLFLYLIHEDLELRHGDTPRYLPQSRRFEPRRANVRCLYLVTYWEQEGSRGGGAPASEPDSQAVKVLNGVTKALLSMRFHPLLQHCSVRVIEPEALNSLGNFWQSLGDKPKTIINFSVTIPLSFETAREAPIVTSSDLEIGQGSDSWEILLEHYLLEELRQALRDSSVPVNAMNKVVLQVTPILDESSVYLQQLAKIQVTGVASASVEAFLGPLIAAWRGETVTPGKEPIKMQEVRNTIIPISVPGSDSWQAQLKHYLLEELRDALEDEMPVSTLDEVELRVTLMPDASLVANKNPSKQAKIWVTGVVLASVADVLTDRIRNWVGEIVDVADESITMAEVENTISPIPDPVRR